MKDDGNAARLVACRWLQWPRRKPTTAAAVALFLFFFFCQLFLISRVKSPFPFPGVAGHGEHLEVVPRLRAVHAQRGHVPRELCVADCGAVRAPHSALFRFVLFLNSREESVATPGCGR